LVIQRGQLKLSKQTYNKLLVEIFAHNYKTRMKSDIAEYVVEYKYGLPSSPRKRVLELRPLAQRARARVRANLQAGRAIHD